jgi:hypothetical protein
MDRCQFSVLRILKYKSGLRFIGANIGAYVSENISSTEIEFSESVGDQDLHLADVLGSHTAGSHERMLEIQADEKPFEDWKEANYEFVRKVFGKENIIRFTLHLDRKTPHIHCIVVPISPQGRLSARYYINGSEKLEFYQDQYAADMAPFCLLRGISKTLTHREHMPTREYHYRKIQALQNIFLN